MGDWGCSGPRNVSPESEEMVAGGAESEWRDQRVPKRRWVLRSSPAELASADVVVELSVAAAALAAHMAKVRCSAVP